MPELRERFASLSRTSAPDLWPEIDGREPRNPIEPSSSHRVVAAFVAFVVAIAGIGIAAVTFGGSDRPAASGTPGPLAIANGPIYFRVGGGEGGSRVATISRILSMSIRCITTMLSDRRRRRTSGLGYRWQRRPRLPQ